MNIDILFRAKRKDNGEWVQGFYVKCRGHHYILPVYDKDHGFDERYSDWVKVDSKTVCQYTGLTDKNGRKIFEADILKRVLLPTKRIKNNFKIVFVSANSCFSAIDLDGSNVTFISDYINSNYEIEVIGNIFDNPELMEV